jgi:Invasion associated locus B (IalB) protein
MKHPTLLPVLAAVAVFALAAGEARAANGGTKTLGSFGPWSAYSYGGPRGTVCYVYAEPKKEAGQYTERGDTYIQIADRPTENIANELSVTAGYPYKQGSEVALDIDGGRFSLFTDSETAWARDAKTQDEIVKAMKAGRQLEVRGTSSRGTLTTDTYSLAGFTAAIGAASRACGIR